MLIRLLLRLLFMLPAFAPLPAVSADIPLIATGAAWKYKDDGSNQGTVWRATAFDDSTWASGPAQLGYGDGDEATVVSFGPNSTAKFITTYFRKSFTVTNPAQYSGLALNLVRDDGAVVYLNGTEVWRINMPTGTIDYLTLAPTAIGSTDESAWYTITLSPSLLMDGANVIAVEMHQQSGTSSDISFNLSLIASDGAPSLTRQPYLQMGTPTAMTIRWRTNVATDSRVLYGTTQGALSSFKDDAALTTEHEVRLTGLLPDTKYFYAVGSTTATLGGNDAGTYFFTNPTPGTVRPYRFWVIGDAGTGQSAQAAVRDAYATFNGTQRTDLWLQLGDNAYQNGLDNEYQATQFNIYTSMFKTSVCWPAIGNHDTAQATNPPLTIPYFQMFTLPTAAEAGGLASGTEKYYSFDYGNVHFVELDSQTSSRQPGAAMATWLQNDLAQNTKRWTVVYFHHPPYSKGTHDSDTESQLIEMRQYLNPIMEAGGVDLVLAGHSHTYERSYLLDGHYGSSGTLTEAMKINGSGGPYTKAGTGTHEGTVYVVAGTSGRLGSNSGIHPAMFSTRTEAGSLVIDVNGDKMDVRFLTQAGVMAESFTINKGATVQPPAAPSALNAAAVSASQINLTWADNSSNETGFKIERSSDNGANFSEIFVTAANATSYSNTGLVANTAYLYRVRATNAAGDSSYSNNAGATTLPNAPVAPDGLAAAAASASQIDLSWTDNNSNEDGTRIERSVNGTTFTQVATVGANVTSYADAGLNAGTQYWYRVRAYNAGGNSPYSGTATATTLAGPPAAPTALLLTAVSSSRIDLRWTDNAANESEYRVEQSLNGTSWTEVTIQPPLPANATAYSRTGLARNTRYYFRVRAWNAAGFSGYSNVANIKTKSR